MPLIVQDNRHVHKQGNGVKWTQLLKWPHWSDIISLSPEKYKMTKYANLSWWQPLNLWIKECGFRLHLLQQITFCFPSKTWQSRGISKTWIRADQINPLYSNRWLKVRNSVSGVDLIRSDAGFVNVHKIDPYARKCCVSIWKLHMTCSPLNALN